MNSPSLFRALVAALAACSAFLTLASPIPDEFRVGGFAIGCQAYSFNRFSVFEAIEKTAEAGGKVIEFYPGQKLTKEEPNVKWSHDASDEVIARVKEKLAKHGVRAVNYGVVGIPKDEAGARKVFEFAKKMGLYGVTTESIDALDTADKLAKEYDIRVGIHEHAKRMKKDADGNYWLLGRVDDLVERPMPIRAVRVDVVGAPHALAGGARSWARPGELDGRRSHSERALEAEQPAQPPQLALFAYSGARGVEQGRQQAPLVSAIP